MQVNSGKPVLPSFAELVGWLIRLLPSANPWFASHLPLLLYQLSLWNRCPLALSENLQTWALARKSKKAGNLFLSFFLVFKSSQEQLHARTKINRRKDFSETRFTQANSRGGKINPNIDFLAWKLRMSRNMKNLTREHLGSILNVLRKHDNC